MTIEEKIRARLAELRQAELEAQTRLIAIRTAIGELEQLLVPAEPVIAARDERADG